MAFPRLYFVECGGQIMLLWLRSYVKIYVEGLTEGLSIMVLSAQRKSFVILLLLMVSAVCCVLVSGCGKEEAKKRESNLLKAAKEAISDGDFDRAVMHLEKTIELDPDEAEAYLKLALIYENIRLEREKAREYYEKYIEVEKDETLRNTAKVWLDNLSAGESAGDDSKGDISWRLTRLAVERQKMEHERGIERLKAEHEREIRDLERRWETAEHQASKSAVSEVPTDGTEEIAALRERVRKLESELDVTKENESAHIDRLTKTKEALEQKEKENTELSKQLTDTEDKYKNALSMVRKLEREKSKLAVNGSAADASSGTEGTDEGAAAEASTNIIGKTRTDVEGVKQIRGNTIYYKVQSDDTLMRIAEKFYDDKRKWSVIFTANRDVLDSEDNITLGQTIRIPILK